MHLAVSARKAPFLLKLTLYLALSWLSTQIEWGHLLWFLPVLPAIALFHPLSPLQWFRHVLRFWPVAGLPLLAWAVGTLAGQDPSGWPLALQQSFRYWLLFLFSDLFSALVSPRQIRGTLGFWPDLATAVTLFLTFLSWLRQELEVLHEAAALRTAGGKTSILRLRAQVLFNLLVRGMEQARDKGDSLYLRISERRGK